MKASRIRLIPPRSYWGVVLLFTFLCIAFAAIILVVPNPKSDPQSNLAILPLIGILMVFPAAIVIWLRLFYVEADAEGVRWRTLRGTVRAVWPDITDYYLRRVTKDGKSSERLVVEAKNGKVTFGADWSGDIPGFRETVRQHAGSARANSWERLGTRRDLDWPREFNYRTPDNRSMRWVTLLLVASGPAMSAWLLWRKMPFDLSDPGSGWTIAMLSIVMVAYCAKSAFGVVLLRAQLRIRPLFDDMITVYDSGLTLRRNNRVIRFAWASITDYYINEKGGIAAIGTGRYIVESGGDRIEFNQSIGEARLLLEIIKREATSAESRDWKNIQRDKENLDTAAPKWTGGAIGHGTRLFHYRTRSIRALLVCLISILGAPLIQTAFFHLGLIDRHGPPAAYCYSVLAFTVWIIWRYQSGGVAINSYGITERTPVGDHTIAWPSITSYGIVGDDSLHFGKVTSESGRTILFWTYIGDAVDLMEEIRRNTPRAKGNWKAVGGKHGEARDQPD